MSVGDARNKRRRTAAASTGLLSRVPPVASSSPFRPFLRRISITGKLGGDVAVSAVSGRLRRIQRIAGSSIAVDRTDQMPTSLRVASRFLFENLYSPD